MSYVGAASPGDRPEHYMSCVQYVYEAYVSTSPRLPLIVNTMGWIEGVMAMIWLFHFKVFVT